MDAYPFPPEKVLRAFQAGLVIPAHPLALTPEKTLDERHQRCLTRYYLDAGAGGLAVGVHTTEFKIHEPGVGLYRPVLELALETAREGGRNPVMIAGISGTTDQAVDEAVPHGDCQDGGERPSGDHGCAAHLTSVAEGWWPQRSAARTRRRRPSPPGSRPRPPALR